MHIGTHVNATEHKCWRIVLFFLNTLHKFIQKKKKKETKVCYIWRVILKSVRFFFFITSPIINKYIQITYTYTKIIFFSIYFIFQLNFFLLFFFFNQINQAKHLYWAYIFTHIYLYYYNLYKKHKYKFV